MQIFTAAYNPGTIKKADLPTTFEDLLNPKWKGKRTEAADCDWFSAVVSELAGEGPCLPRHRDPKRARLQGSHAARQPGGVGRVYSR